MLLDACKHIVKGPLKATGAMLVPPECNEHSRNSPLPSHTMSQVGRSLLSWLMVAFFAAVCGGCRSNGGRVVAPSVTDDSQIVAFEQEHRMNTEVTGKVRVYKLLEADDEGLRHERFLVMLSDGSTVLVAHSIDKAPAVPVSPDDTIVIHGEYVWNAKGGVIHWTHHSDSPRHEGGWIDFKGKRYE